MMNYNIFAHFRLIKNYQIDVLDSVVWQGTQDEWKECQKNDEVCWRIESFLKREYSSDDLPKKFQGISCGPTAHSLVLDENISKYFDGKPYLDYMRLNSDGSWTVSCDGVLYRDNTPNKAIKKALDSIKNNGTI